MCCMCIILHVSNSKNVLPEKKYFGAYVFELMGHHQECPIRK